jgi:hypothetical protein
MNSISHLKVPEIVSVTRRLFAGVKINKNTKCWEWYKVKIWSGYGLISVRHKNNLVHRLSWMLHKGDIPEDKVLLHSCDNRSCINPHHLRLGTLKENAQEMADKGRHPLLKSDSPLRRGKITTENVIEIRKNENLKPAKYFAEKFGVSVTHVRKIMNYQVRFKDQLRDEREVKK